MPKETTPSVAEQADERAAFEAWIKKDSGDLSTFGSGSNMHYRNSAVNNAWTGWETRAALAASQAASHSAPEPAGYLIDPGAGSARDRVQRDKPSESQMADIQRRGGSVTPLAPLGAESKACVSDARVIEAARTVAKIWDQHGYPTEIHALSLPLNALSHAIAASPALSVGLSVTVEAVATVRRVDGNTYLDWLIEGGIAAMAEGETLMICGERLTDDNGSGEVYLNPPEAPAVTERPVALHVSRPECRGGRWLIRAEYGSQKDAIAAEDWLDGMAGPVPAVTEGASRELQLLQVENAGLQSSVGHLGALVDELRGLTQRAIKAMSALHSAATPDESTEDIDAIIPGHAFAAFVNEHAALLYGFAHHTDMPAATAAAVPESPAELARAMRKAIDFLTPEGDGSVGPMGLASALATLRSALIQAPAATEAPTLREACAALLSLIRRDAPHLSGKVLGDAQAALAAVGASVQPVQASLSDEQRKDLLMAALYLSSDEGDAVLTSTDATRIVQTLFDVGNLDALVDLASSTPSKGGQTS